MKDILLAFILGGIAGPIFEKFQGSTATDRLLDKIGIGKYFSLIYGLAIAFLWWLQKTYPGANLLVLAFIAAILFTAVECVNGLIGEQIYQTRNWTYDWFDSFCNGYTAVRVSFVWFILSYIILLLFKHISASM